MVVRLSTDEIHLVVGWLRANAIICVEVEGIHHQSGVSFALRIEVRHRSDDVGAAAIQGVAFIQKALNPPVD
jgi:hypothetical protein